MQAQAPMPDLTAYAASAQRADEAKQSAHESVAASYAAFLDLAILRGDDTPMRTAWGRTPYTASEILVDTCGKPERALLFKAVHLTRAGQYEAGSKALLAFAEALCAEFGASMADEFALDE